MQAAQIGPRRGSFLGLPLQGFGLLASLLLSFAAGFIGFFGSTGIAIFVLLAWNLSGRHAINYADSYLYVGVPLGLLVLVVALGLFLTLWARAKFHK